MFWRVVAGIDGSSPSQRILACLGGLRSVGTREVLLVHALRSRTEVDDPRVASVRLERRLEALRSTVERMGFVASVEIAPGLPAAELVRVAHRRSASLVVLGAESSRARDLLRGSVPVQVLHRSDLPVLVPGAAPDPASRVRAAAGADLAAHVLYATDFNPAAERALEFVVGLVRDGARRVTLVRVHDPPRRKRLEHLARRLLIAGADDVRVEAPTGTPEREIARIASDARVSLVVVGTRGRGSAGTYLGSVGYAVARASRSPVLLVPPDRPASRDG